MQRACRLDQPIDYAIHQGATHQTIPFVSQNQYVRWIADRFARPDGAVELRAVTARAPARYAPERRRAVRAACLNCR